MSSWSGLDWTRPLVLADKIEKTISFGKLIKEKTIMDCSKSVQFFGIDVHKNTLVLDGGALKLSDELANNQSGFKTLIGALRKSPHSIQVVFEATGNYHVPLALALWQAQVPLSIVNGARVRQFANALGKAKTDTIDQALISRFAESLQPAAQPAPSATLRELQQIVSRRLVLVASKVQEENRLGQCLHETLLFVFYT